MINMILFPPIRSHLFEDDHGVLGRRGPRDRQRGSGQGHIGQASLSHPRAVVGDLEGTALVVIQPTTCQQQGKKTKQTKYVIFLFSKRTFLIFRGEAVGTPWTARSNVFTATTRGPHCCPLKNLSSENLPACQHSSG